MSTGAKIKVVYSFSYANEEHLDKIKGRLYFLESIGTITNWDRRDIPPGTDKEIEVKKNFYGADIILVLISPEYFGPELDKLITIEKSLVGIYATQGHSTVIPIHLKYTDILEDRIEHLADFQSIPQNGWILDGNGDYETKITKLAIEIRKVIEKCKHVERKPLEIFTEADIEKTLKKQLFNHFEDFNNEKDGVLFNVFKAKDKWLNRPVIIKVINPWVSDEQDKNRNRKKAKKEIQEVANYRHRNIKRVYFGSKTDELTYVTMEYVEGDSLREIIDREGPQPLWEVKNLLLDLMDAVYYGHKRGAVHNYITPLNIYIDKEIKPVLSPFKIINLSHLFDVVNKENMMYWSPEKLNSCEDLDSMGVITERSDQFSLGLIGYELITGHPLYSGEIEDIQAARKEYARNPEPIRKKLTDYHCPDGLADILIRMMSIDQKDRFKNLIEVSKLIKMVDLKLEGKVKKVLESYDRSYAANPDMIDTFYKEFFSMAPEAEDYFHEPNFNEQKWENQYYKLHHSVRTLLILASKFRDRNNTLKSVAHTHKEKGIPIYLFQKFKLAFVKVLSTHDKEWESDPSIREAWEELMSRGISFMKGQYENENATHKILSEFESSAKAINN